MGPHHWQETIPLAVGKLCLLTDGLAESSSHYSDVLLPWPLHITRGTDWHVSVTSGLES
jgi:hypothetical protein